MPGKYQGSSNNDTGVGKGEFMFLILWLDQV